MSMVDGVADEGGGPAMDGATPVLLADCRVRSLRDLRVGDMVYGAQLSGRYHRYVITEVLARWQTRGPGFRTALDDGAVLTTGSGHRFLSERGWKHIEGTEQGAGRRPHLTLNNRLLGTGRFAVPPSQGADYQRGYLCGMIRGDGAIGHYSYERPGRARGCVHRFRLALADAEALERSRVYLAGFGVPTTEFTFSDASPHRRGVQALRTQRRAAVAAIEDIISWPRSPPGEWMSGFLSGIFDAEGSCSRGVFRIANSDPEILRRIELGLDHFGFAFVAEGPRTSTNKPVFTIRLTGGLRERLRFFHRVDPAITRKRSMEGVALKSGVPVRVDSIEVLGADVELHGIGTSAGTFVSDGLISKAAAPVAGGGAEQLRLV